MSYCIYGKRIRPVFGVTTEPDKVFRPINEQGIRVVSKAQAIQFSSREEAKEFLGKQKLRKEAVFEIRRI